MAQHLCPWWVGYLLANPLRRLIQNPRKILAPYVRPGMTVLDIGPGMGSFTLDLARFTGPAGRVIAVDVQPRMLKEIERRAANAGLLDRVETLVADDDGAWAGTISGRVDLALAFYMVHEVRDVPRFFSLVRATLAPRGRLLVVEPKVHVSAKDYADTIAAARNAGLEIVDRPKIKWSMSALLEAR
jgi:cyclopropane fatty-acyl-phospholipid synthase-like methyltransferase